MGRTSNYNESYKREAVAKADSSGNVSQTARELGISNKSLHGWIKQYGAPMGVDTASEKELAARVWPLTRMLTRSLARRYNLTPDAVYADACHLCYATRERLRGRFPAILAPEQMYGPAGADK
jgi:transposase-like protein